MFKASAQCVDLIIKFECSGNIVSTLTAYLCPAKIWTVGIGTTYYHDGEKVKQGDIITAAQALDFFHENLKDFEACVNNTVKSDINQNQFDALVSFCYNVGQMAFKKSTLLSVINQDPNDAKIIYEFQKWNRVAGNIVNGLMVRRKAEYELYFKK